MNNLKMMRNLQWMFTLVLLAIPGLMFAENLSHIPAAFLDVGLGAAPMGMGGTTAALGHDVYSIVANPAGLINVKDPQVAFSMTRQFSLIPYNLVLYGQRVLKHTSVGLGLLTSGDDALSENTVFLSGARILPMKLVVGMNLKLHFSSFGNNDDGQWIFEGGNRQVQGSAKGYALDLGMKGILSGRILYGLLLKDVLGSINYDASNEVATTAGGISERIPPKLIVGLGYVPNANLRTEIDLNKSLYRDTNDRVYVGAERQLFTFFALRGGISQNINAAESNRHYALGLGIQNKFNSPPVDFGMDFAYLMNEFHNFFHVGIRLVWDRK